MFDEGRWMVTTWIVVASRDQVRVFSRKGLERLQLEWEVGNASGRLKNQDLESDRHGASTDNRMRAQQAYSTEEEARDRLLKNFYREFLSSLEHAFVAQDVDKLIIAAEPRLLGVLRQLLPHSLSRALSQEIHKDLWHENAEAITMRIS